MSYFKTKYFSLLSLFVIFSKVSFAAEPTFALKVASWYQDYQVSVQTPSIMYDRSEVKISMYAPNAPFFSASSHLTHGGCENVAAMDVQDVLSVPKSFISNGVEFEYVRAEGDLVQIVNMYNGQIGLAVANPSPYSCQYYMDLTNQGGIHPNWYGSGKTFTAIYKIKRLPEPGVHKLSLSVDSYFTRRERGSHWVNMGSLSGYQSTRVVSSDYRVTAWCKVINKDVELDHKLMTPDLVEGNVVSTDVRLECGGGGKGRAKLSLSNKSNKSTVNLGNNVLSEVSLSATEVNVAKDSSVKIAVSSKLTTSSKEIIAGELNGTEVLTVEWL
ncbi:TPA: hypothetical protein H1V26_001021 [Salmonella enterica]|nr:hypothetical protein [Salmonella enterica]HAK5615626.1 hypothetical protein [Salmonella enterica]